MKYLIVANGPFIPSQIIHELREGKKILALDGASIKLAKIGILPDIILGDFDSIKDDMQIWGIQQSFEDITEDSSEYSGKYGIKIVPAKNQDYTDLFKAIEYCDNHNATHIDIVCTIGGRMDHTLNNLRTLRAKYKLDRPLTIYTESQILTFAKDSTVQIAGNVQDTCAIMAFPQGSFSSTGLAWNGSDSPLTFGLSESVCNSLATQQADIQISGEALVIHPGSLPSQKNNSELAYYQQLEILCLAMKYIISEVTIRELKAMREIRKSVKDTINIQKKSDLLTDIHYLSHKKEDIYKAVNNNDNETVLVSISPQKQYSWEYFRNISSGKISKDNKDALIRELPEHYRKRLS